LVYYLPPILYNKKCVDRIRISRLPYANWVERFSPSIPRMAWYGLAIDSFASIG